MAHTRAPSPVDADQSVPVFSSGVGLATGRPNCGSERGLLGQRRGPTGAEQWKLRNEPDKGDGGSADHVGQQSPSLQQRWVRAVASASQLAAASQRVWNSVLLRHLPAATKSTSFRDTRDLVVIRAVTGAGPRPKHLPACGLTSTNRRRGPVHSLSASCRRISSVSMRDHTCSILSARKR